MILSLRQVVPDLYTEYRFYLWAGSASLTLPLLLRFVLDLVWTYDSQWYGWVYSTDHQERSTTYNLVDFILTTYLPIVS